MGLWATNCNVGDIFGLTVTSALIDSNLQVFKCCFERDDLEHGEEHGSFYITLGLGLSGSVSIHYWDCTGFMGFSRTKRKRQQNITRNPGSVLVGPRGR